MAEITLQAKRRRREEEGEGASGDDGDDDERRGGRARGQEEGQEGEKQGGGGEEAAPTDAETNFPLFSSAPISASSAAASNAALDAAAFERVAGLLFAHFLPTSADPRLRRSGAYRSLRSSLHWWLLRRPTAVVGFARAASGAWRRSSGAAACARGDRLARRPPQGLGAARRQGGRVRVGRAEGGFRGVCGGEARAGV